MLFLSMTKKLQMYSIFILGILFGGSTYLMNAKIARLEESIQTMSSYFSGDTYNKQQEWLNKKILEDEELTRVKNLNTQFLSKYGNPPKALLHINTTTGDLLEEARFVFIKSNGTFDLTAYWECVMKLPSDLSEASSLRGKCISLIKE